jgi:TPR repeat protein
MYEDGLSVTKDLDQARAWYQKAADQDFKPAKESLNKLGQ